MGRKHKTKLPKNGGSDNLGQTITSEKKPSMTIDAIMELLKEDNTGSKEDYELYISELKKKLDDNDATKKLVLILNEEQLASDSAFSNHTVINNLGNVVGNDAAKLFSTDSDQASFEKLPSDLQGLIRGARNVSNKKQEFIVSELGRNSVELLSLIQLLKDHNTAKQAATNSENTRIPLEEMASLGNNRLLFKSSDGSTEEVTWLSSEINVCHSELDEHETSESQQNDENASGVLEKMKILLGLDSGSSSLLEAVQALQFNFRQQQMEAEFNQKAAEEKESALRKLMTEKSDVAHKSEDILKENQKLKDEMASERQAAKLVLKKIRKERDSILKKFKRLTEEVSSENKETLQKNTVLVTEDFRPNGLTDESNEKPIAELLDIEATDKLADPQTMTGCLQKRFEDVCQQLETSEKSLEVQQELNARITKLSADNRTRHSFEISELNEVIQRLKMNNAQQGEEILRIKELERRKTDVLVNVLEDEKQKIRDECDSIKIQLDEAKKALKEQKSEAKRHLEAELWKVKKAIKTAEKRRALDKSNSEERESETHEKNPLSPDSGSKQSQIDVSEIMKKLEIQTNAMILLRNENKQLGTKLNEMTAIHELKEQAFEELLVVVDKKDRDLRAEIKKFEDLQQEVLESLEKEDASEKRIKSLDEREIKLESMRVEYEAASKDLMERIMNSDEEKVKLQRELKNLEKHAAQKDAQIEKLSNENSRLQTETNLLEKKLEDFLSPRKDRTSQLESRLEVMQTAAKAQQKRSEEEMQTSRIQLENVSKRNEELLKQIEELQLKKQEAEDMAFALNEALSHVKGNEGEVAELGKSLSVLQTQYHALQLENAKERTGLVNELIDTKEKLKECLKSSSKQKDHLEEIKTLREQLMCAKAIQHEHDTRSPAGLSSDQSTQPEKTAIDDLFPHLDPVLRQIAELLLKNQSYLYGLLCLFVYALLIHLYILL